MVCLENHTFIPWLKGYSSDSLDCPFLVQSSKFKVAINTDLLNMWWPFRNPLQGETLMRDFFAVPFSWDMGDFCDSNKKRW